MIINIRGTNGSGKTTAVRRYLQTWPATPILGAGGRTRGYRVRGPAPLLIVGRYDEHAAAGGCDTFKSAQDALDFITEHRRPGERVVFEGLMLSGLVTRVVAWATPHREEFVAAVLLPPMKLCYERIALRRAQYNVNRTKPFDPQHVIRKDRAVRSSARSLEAAGLRVVTLDHERAFEHTLELFGWPELR